MKSPNRHRSNKKVSIRMKLIGSFALIAMIMFGMNALMYSNINQMLSRLEEVYIENVSLNTLISELACVQTAMTEYLNTKSSDSMEDYFRSTQKLSDSLSHLNTEVTDNSILLMEKNIYHISETYLDITNETIQSKRGRLIDKYKVSYKEASELYDYLNTYLYSLNNKQFNHNTQNYNHLLTTFKALELTTIVILVLAFAAMILMLIQLTRSITYPLSRLAKVADEVACGNFEIELPKASGNDEVGVLAKAFNQMIDSIRTYIGQITKNMEIENQMKEKELLMEAHLKDAKLKYLQAQIHPHFLFNTLNAGAQLAMMEEADRTYEYIQNVASFYRYNICKSDEPTCLQEEIQLIDNYIYILNVRYCGDIIFDKSINSLLLDTKIPRMVLQPIVENAVKYGIQEVDWKGKICISVREQVDKVEISIQDNGIGMSQEKIQKIIGGEALINEEESNSNGVGLMNVKNRLNLYYNSRDILQIYSAGRNLGTEVKIVIPKM